MILQIQSALKQVLYVLILSTLFFLPRLLYRKRQRVSFFEFIGIQITGFKFNRFFFLTLLAFAVLGAIHTYISLQFDPATLSLLKSDTSPYGVIIRSNSQFKIIMAIVYCYIQSGLAEEILFRGLIAKRLYFYFGFIKGNIIQALIFWLLHALLIRFVTVVWISFSQLSVLIFIMFMGLFFGYYIEKRAQGSIVPSWLFHGTANFATFLVLLTQASKI